MAFDALWDLDEAIRAVALKDGRTFADLCLTVGGACAVSSILEFWPSRAAYAAAVTSDADVRAAVSSATLSNGFPVSRASLFGKYETSTGDPETGALTWTGGTQVVYNIDSDKADEAAEQEWEELFLRACGVHGAPARPVLKQERAGLFVVPYAYRTLDSELTRVVTIDMPLVMVEYLAMFAFIALALGYGQRASKVGQAAGTVAGVVLSTMAAYGICAAAGIPMTQLILILPFILVGIGVDDAFVIIAAYRQLPPPATPEEVRAA